MKYLRINIQNLENEKKLKLFEKNKKNWKKKMRGWSRKLKN